MYEYDRRTATTFDRDTLTILSPPADLSKKAVVGWIAGIRVKALDFPVHSTERKQFLDEAVRKLGYVEFLTRSNRPLVAFLKQEGAKLPHLLTTEGD